MHDTNYFANANNQLATATNKILQAASNLMVGGQETLKDRLMAVVRELDDVGEFVNELVGMEQE